MGDIVLFRLREGQKRKKDDSVARSGGQIVFFTGVRYERMPEASVGVGESGAPPAGGLGGAGRGGRRRRG